MNAGFAKRYLLATSTEKTVAKKNFDLDRFTTPFG